MPKFTEIKLKWFEKNLNRIYIYIWRVRFKGTHWKIILNLIHEIMVTEVLSKKYGSLYKTNDTTQGCNEIWGCYMGIDII